MGNPGKHLESQATIPLSHNSSLASSFQPQSFHSLVVFSRNKFLWHLHASSATLAS